MVGTGDWGIQELAKYLVAVRGSLTPVELERLKHTAAFRQEVTAEKPDGKVVRKTLTELYEPTDQFRELGLPLLDWSGAHKWRSNSDEGNVIDQSSKTLDADLSSQQNFSTNSASEGSLRSSLCSNWQPVEI